MPKVVQTIEEKAVSQRVSLERIRSVELNEVFGFDDLLCFYMFNKPLRLVALYRELKHRQYNFARLRVKHLPDEVLKVIEPTAVDVLEFF